MGRAFLTVIVFLLIHVGAARARDTMDERKEREHVEALCARGAFEEAERYCLQRQVDGSLEARSRVFYAIQRSHCLVRRALAASPPEAESLWQSAEANLEEMAKQPFPPPRLLLLGAQKGLVALTRGVWLAERAEFSGDEKQKRDAVGALRRSIADLKRLDEPLSAEVRRRTTPREEDRLRPDELRSLSNQIQFHQGQGHVWLGKLHAPRTPDRIDALNQAVSLFGPLADLPSDQPLAWESRLELVEALRLRRSFDEAERLLKRLEAEPGSPTARLRLRATAIRMALDQEDLARALSLAELGREIEATTSPELDEAFLEAALAAWSDADKRNRPDESRHWQEKAQAIVESLAKNHVGAYWQERGKRLVARAARSNGVADVGLLVQAAETHYRSGDLESAIATYDRASSAAEAVGNLLQTFDLAFLAATIEHQRRHWTQASKRYRELALRFAKHDRASEAHLLAAHDELQRLREESIHDQATYGDLLREHLRLWPSGPSASEAQWRLARLLEHQGDWLAAADLYRAVGPAHQRGVDSIASTLRCYKRMLAAQDPREPKARPEILEAARYFQRLALTEVGAHDEVPPEARDTAALAAAELLIDLGEEGPAAAEQILSSYLDKTEPAAERRDELEGMRLLAIVAQGDLHRVQNQIETLNGLPPAQLYSCLRALHSRRRAEEEADETSQAKLLLLLFDKLEPRLKELSPDQQRDCRAWKAMALADAGQRDEAAEQMAAIVQEDPSLVTIAEYARLLSDSTKERDWSHGLELWRTVERGAKVGSQAWFEAKLQLAQLHARLGNDEQARKILRLTELLHPELGGSASKAKFEALRQRLSE
jgi:tetratricopeptide (TPR) repeat protein